MIILVDMLQIVEPVSAELRDNYIKRTQKYQGWRISEDSQQKISRSFHLLFDSVVNFVAKVKSTEQPVALEVYDDEHNFQFAAKVKYYPNDDDEMPGSWALSFPVEREKISDCKIYTTESCEFKDFAADLAKHQYGFYLNIEEGDIVEEYRLVVTRIISAAALAIRDWVDEFSISRDPHITSIVGKVVIEAMLDENNHKVCCLTPSAEMKLIVKDDAAIEAKKKEEQSEKEA